VQEAREQEQREERERQRSNWEYVLWLLGFTKGYESHFRTQTADTTSKSGRHSFIGRFRLGLLRWKQRRVRVRQRLKWMGRKLRSFGHLAGRFGRGAMSARGVQVTSTTAKSTLSKVTPAGKAMMRPGARFAGKFGGKLLLRGGLSLGAKILIGVGVAALALTPLGWSIGAIALGAAIGIGVSLAVDFGLDCMSKWCNGKSFWDGVTSTAGEWYNTARNAITGFGRKLLNFDFRGAGSDLITLSYNAADLWSCGALDAVVNSSGSQMLTAWFKSSVLGTWWMRGAVMTAVGAEAWAHPAETVEFVGKAVPAIANAAVTGFSFALGLTGVDSFNGAVDRLSDPTVWETAGVAGGSYAALKSMGAIGDVVGKGFRDIVAVSAIAGLGTYAVNHPEQTMDALGATVRTARENPELTTAGLIGITYAVSPHARHAVDKAVGKAIPTGGLAAMKLLGVAETPPAPAPAGSLLATNVPNSAPVAGAMSPEMGF
jgi:hypothetical protein